MTNKESSIGKNIICGRSGIGKIVEITSLHDGGEEFYKVTFPKDQCINYFSINNQNNYRILASEEIINKAIKIFKSKVEKVEYTTTQEKVNTQKEMLKEGDILKLAKTLSMLGDEKNLHVQVSKPFNNALDSFIDEIEFVLNIKRSEVYSKLKMKVPTSKVKK